MVQRRTERQNDTKEGTEHTNGGVSANGWNNATRRGTKIRNPTINIRERRQWRKVKRGAATKVAIAYRMCEEHERPKGNKSMDVCGAVMPSAVVAGWATRCDPFSLLCAASSSRCCTRTVSLSDATTVMT